MRVRLTILLVVLPVLTWTLYGVFAGRVASLMSSKYGTKILAKGDGKFTDPGIFVKGLLEDATVLMTASCVLLLAYQKAASLAERRLQTPARWVAQGWSAFVCLNVLAAVAAHTALFWCLLYSGKNDIQNYTQWHIKEALMKDASEPSQAILLGNSQTHVQIDPKILNQRLAGKIWTTELHFPGSSIYDTMLSLERIRSDRVKYVITYVSITPFYGEAHDFRLVYYFGLRDLPTYWKLGSGKPDFDRRLVGGLLADIFPVYQIWEPLMARLRAGNGQKLAQARYDASLESSLEDRARRVAKGYEGEDNKFQMRAFALLAQACRERGCRLVVCAGQCNPILDRALNPSIHRDVMDFLREQAAKDPNIILLQESQMPRQVETDYDGDLTHVNAAARLRFSQYIAEVLDKLNQTNAVGLNAYPDPR